MPLSRAGKTLLIAEVVFTLALVGIAETALRWIVSRPTSTLYPEVFFSPITTGKYLAYRQLDAPVDVLLMGMSQMMRVSAEGLGERLSSEASRRTAFNFSAPMHSVEFDRQLLMRVVVPINKPQTVVYGVIPTGVMMEASEAEMRQHLADYPVFSAYAPTATALLHRWLLNDLDLVLYREALARRLAGRDDAPWQMWTKVARRISQSGDTPAPRFADPKGFNRREQERLSAFLRPFDDELPKSRLFSNVRALAETCRERGIRLVLLANPLHPLYLGLLPRGQDDLDSFLDRVRDLAAAIDVPLLVPTANGLGDPDLYVDATHHNQAGMDWITAKLAYFLRQQHL